MVTTPRKGNKMIQGIGIIYKEILYRYAGPASNI